MNGAAATDAGGAARAARGAERWTIFILLLLYTLAYLDRQVITLLIEPIRRDLGVGDVEMGFLQGMGFTLFFALAGPFLGWMVDRYRRRLIIWAGVSFWSLCTAACGLADTYGELLIARFGVGAGEAALLPAAYSIISDLVEKSRLSRAMATFSLGAIAGGALSFALGGAIIGLVARYGGAVLPLIGPVQPWQLVFLSIGAIGLPLATLVWAIHEPERRRSGGVPGSVSAGGMDHFRRHWRFYALHIAGFSLMCMITAAHVAWKATVLIRDYHWRVETIGWSMGLLSLICGAIGMYGSGVLADWLFRRGWRDAHVRIYIFALPVMAAAAALAYSGQSIWLTLAGFAVLGLGSPFIAVAAAALQLTTPPERRGLVSAVFLMVYNLVGFGLGPAAVALVSKLLFGEQGDIASAMAITFVAVTPLAMLCFALAGKPMREAAAAIAGTEEARGETTG
ncbi:MFS transporter [Novosphingobium sp.]|uniref:MFS transporter n=1 Tax=Novosphingobium sp. TaxID=1874826 RepID=UPI001ECFF440|nr:MFS transporter [Novosphingobium sp.]MBK9010368.1 MFS transporter [Novosphingobium sp.]